MFDEHTIANIITIIAMICVASNILALYFMTRAYKKSLAILERDLDSWAELAKDAYSSYIRKCQQYERLRHILEEQNKLSDIKDAEMDNE